MMTMTIEPVSAFSSLDVLVALDEGWMASWGLIHGTFDVTTQINRQVEREAHDLAFASREPDQMTGRAR